MGYYEEVKTELGNALSDFKSAKSQVDVIFGQLEEKRKQLEAAKDVVKKMAEERQIGFPVLADAYDDFFKLQDQKLIDFLKYKDKSAIRAAEILAEYAKVRREALRNKRIAQYLVEYYESVCPFLIDLKEEVADITEEDKKLLAEYSDEELQDEAVRYLTKEEYRQLSPAERNQLALDRFWKRPKSKWLIGRLYERYVGYLYETQGYNVEYQGIVKGLEDLGRDLICHKGSSVVVIQCKNWSHFKTIYEKHIFQFFGTVFQYRDANPGQNVRAVFYTTTQLSDVARRFASELKIELQENHNFDQSYPCIKCNINISTGEKIYHLPFDQQYDKTKISHAGEMYCRTTREAENAGFRRAFRWHGNKVD